MHRQLNYKHYSIFWVTDCNLSSPDPNLASLTKRYDASSVATSDVADVAYM
jgi:hypothetical protein